MCIRDRHKKVDKNKKADNKVGKESEQESHPDSYEETEQADRTGPSANEANEQEGGQEAGVQ